MIQQFHNVKNQFTVQTKKAIYFQSYNSVVVKISKGKITLGADWNYSRTTTKYVGQFLGMNKKEIDKKIKNKEIKVLKENIKIV